MTNDRLNHILWFTIQVFQRKRKFIDPIKLAIKRKYYLFRSKNLVFNLNWYLFNVFHRIIQNNCLFH